MSRPGGNPDRPPLPNGPGHGRTKGAKNKLTRARVEEELRRIALFPMKDLFERTGKHARTFRLRDVASLPPELANAIASVKVRTENLTTGDSKQDTTIEVRLWDKMAALHLCMKYLKMIDDKSVAQEVTESVLTWLDAVKERNRKAKDASD